MSEVIAVTEAEFDAFLIAAGDTPVLVDFWAPWCNPCKLMFPVLDAFAAQNEGAVNVAKVNIDENPALARRYHVRSLPALVMFKAGKPFETNIGTATRLELQGMLGRAVF